MKIRYDSNGFIIACVSNEDDFQSSTGKTYYDVIVDDIPGFQVFDTAYGLPLHKYVNNEIVKITDKTDYLVDYQLARMCRVKCIDHFTDLILTKTLSELKTIYDDLPSDDEKLVFVEALNTFWANEETAFNYNLTWEGVFRILMEVLYIREIEQRSLTQGEQDTYFGMLNNFHDHSANIGGMTTNTWCLQHLVRMLDRCDDVRFNKLIPMRYYIAGY